MGSKMAIKFIAPAMCLQTRFPKQIVGVNFKSLMVERKQVYLEYKMIWLVKKGFQFYS